MRVLHRMGGSSPEEAEGVGQRGGGELTFEVVDFFQAAKVELIAGLDEMAK